MVNHSNRCGKRRIPIAAARRIAEEYGYDQVVIIARKIDKPGATGGEHVTTYGADRANCDVAALIGDFLKHKILGWPRPAEHLSEEPSEAEIAKARTLVSTAGPLPSPWSVCGSLDTAAEAIARFGANLVSARLRQ